MKYGNLAALLFAVLILIKFVLDFTLGLGAKGMDIGTDLVPVKDKIDFFNFTLWSAIIMTFAALLIWFLLEFFGLAINFKSSFKVLISVGAMIIVYIIFYSIASGNEGGRMAELMADPVYNLTPTISKHVSAGLWTTYTLFAISIIAFVGSEILSMFK
jgi:amino acid permease